MPRRSRGVRGNRGGNGRDAAVLLRGGRGLCRCCFGLARTHTRAMARLLLALAAAAAVLANDEGYDPRAVAEEVLEPGFGVVNGDMLLECGSAAELGLDAIGCGGMKNLLTSRGVFRQTYRRWTRVRRNGEYVGAIVPYTIDPAFGENEVRGIESALARLNELTKIVSVEPYNKRVHGAEAPILNFVKASYCASLLQLVER